MDPVYVVVVVATGQTRQVKRACRRCRIDLVRAWPNVVVSVNGTAHHPDDYGHTGCGIDATGDAWWWPT